MSGIKDQERLEELRRRLYARGQKQEERKPYTLPTHQVAKPVAKEWPQPPVPKARPKPLQDIAIAPSQQEPPQEPPADSVKSEVSSLPESEPAPMKLKKRNHQYRLKVVLAGIFFFVIAVAVSSFLLLSGGNTISGENITIDINGPFTVGGGEVIPLQIGLSNNNSVPIQAATLIVEYPLGTQSDGEESRELFIERLPLDTINSGETLNIPLRAVVFGEENAEKTIEASIEYRVEGSNATFFKEAEPLRFKISSSPVVLRVESLKKVSSGQETNIELKVTSNAPTPLSNIIIKAEYPTGFDFIEASPEPVSGNNTWQIDTLAPQETVTITIDAIVVGSETDQLAAHFSVGAPNERDPYTLASVFTTGTTEFEIEEPFINVNVEVNGGESESIVEAGSAAAVTIEFTNTLSDTIYDTVVTAVLSGNAVDDSSVEVPNGFYDSLSNTITWNANEMDSLEELVPGTGERLTFSFRPSSGSGSTPQVDFKVDVKSRRVSERDVPEELIGTASGFARVASVPKMLSEAGYNVAGFSNSGPIPPTAEETTTYTLSLLIQNGSNEISDAEVTATLPNYVSWLDESRGEGTVLFNEITRVVTWRAGSVDSNESAQISFKVGILPSITQIGTTPTLLGEQRLKATDQFTGSTVRATKSALTTEMSTEAGYTQDNGRVVAN